MAWKTREDRLPPPSYFSLIVAYLQQAYRGARISRELMTTLRPFFIEAWRNGKTAEAAAQNTCSCDGKDVVPSPVIGVHIARGTVRPPKGAQRGEVFGAEALRSPAPIERLERKLARIAQAQKKEESIGARWERRAQTARKDAARADATRKLGTAASRYAALQEEAQHVEAELRRLRTELHRTARSAAPPPAAPTPQEPISPVVPPEPTLAAARPRPAPRRRAAEKAEAVASAAKPVAAPEGDAMLSAIRGMLPDLAQQLATQMAAEGSKK